MPNTLWNQCPFAPEQFLQLLGCSESSPFGSEGLQHAPSPQGLAALLQEVIQGVSTTRRTHCKGLYPLVLGKEFLVWVTMLMARVTSSMPEMLDSTTTFFQRSFHRPPARSHRPPFQGASNGITSCSTPKLFMWQRWPRIPFLCRPATMRGDLPNSTKPW